MDFALKFLLIPQRIEFYKKQANSYLIEVIDNFSERKASHRESAQKLEQAQKYLKMAAKGESWWWRGFKWLLQKGWQGFGWLYKKMGIEELGLIGGSLLTLAGATGLVKAVGGLILPASILSGVPGFLIGILGVYGMYKLIRWSLDKLTGKEREIVDKLNLRNPKEAMQALALIKQNHPDLLEEGAKEVAQEEHGEIVKRVAKVTAELDPKESGKIIQLALKKPEIGQAVQQIVKKEAA